MKISNIEVSLVDSMGSDLSVVNAARVSFHKISEEFKEGDIKLINYLAKHKHFSPFNHSFITVRVKAPIFVARQLVKHKFMPWNEVSRRYVDEEPEFFFPDMWRAKADNVKQGSGEDAIDISGLDQYVANPESSVSLALSSYNHLLRVGVCPEQARMVLPQNMMTEWMWSGTLGAFADMLKLRLDPHTQKESRDVAEKIKELVAPIFPVSLTALLDNK
jgi:thymidylate synthase (FAD)